MERKVILLGLSVIFFTSIAVSASVGTVPGNIDFGEVERGETIEYNVYVRATDLDQNFTVSPSTSSARHSMLFADDFRYRSDVSEQSFEEWINIPETEINPETVVENPDIEMSNPPRVHGGFTFRMEIPNDAEPGHRQGKLSLNPDIRGDGSGAGAQVFGQTEMYYRFEIPGDAERDIRVQRVRGFRLGEQEAAVEVLLSNEGTVTSSVENFEIDILDSSRNEETTLQASGTALAPGEQTWVDAEWDSDEPIEEDDNYQIDGSIDYLTGSATASGSFSLPGCDVVKVRPDNSPGSDQD